MLWQHCKFANSVSKTKINWKYIAPSVIINATPNCKNKGQRLLMHFQDGYTAESRSEVRILKSMEETAKPTLDLVFSPLLASCAINLIIKITFFVGRGRRNLTGSLTEGSSN